MSPLWRDQIYISLKPGEVAALRIGKGLRPRMTAKAVVEHPAGGDTPWRNTLAALADLLAKPEWQHADACVVLSNSFARFQIVPPDEQVASEEELQAFARYKMDSVYGDSSGWEIRVSEGKAGPGSVACGVDRALLEAIDGCCRHNRVRLRSVQPYLIAAYNRVRHELEEGAIWFAVAEQNRLCAVFLKNGAWRSIHCRSLAAENQPASLATVLERERKLAGAEDGAGKVLLFAPGAQSSGLPPDFRIVGPAARYGLDWRTDSRFAMAAST